MAATSQPWGLMAEFETPVALMHAAQKVREAGYQKYDAHSPFPIHGMDQAMGLKNSNVGWFTFFGGTTGLSAGMLMIFYMAKWDYPLIVGGKPLFSPLFAFPVSYEMTILLAAFATLFGMFFLNGLPRPYHPLLKTPRFRNATHDLFYLVVERADPKYSEIETRKLLESLGGRHIEVVED
jgi:hypothetical protein